MGKRSDFAQKLLDDLRLRKEKMGMASSGQSSASARPPSAGNANGSSRWSFRGSGEVTTNKSVIMQSNKGMPNTEVAKIWFGTKHHRSPYLKGASQDIVPLGRATSKEQSIDLSMALALALSNSGKLQNIELFASATMGKKLILHHGSLTFRDSDSNMFRPSTEQFPFLSPYQIGEVSNDVKKLNVILKACSNGLNFSRDAIDIGRELLKGAIDLEESLRMLVSLQDASDYMVGSQGKQVNLLKDKEEEEASDGVNNWKLTSRPSFSFDGPSKHSKKIAKEGSNADLVEQKQIVLSYPEKLKAHKSNIDKRSSNAPSQVNSHRQSPSYSPGSKPNTYSPGSARKISHDEELKSFPKDGSSSASTNIKQFGLKGSSRNEKVRIPNVVAKLMGLEELPLPTADMSKSEVKKVPRPNQVIDIDKEITHDVEISKREMYEMTSSVIKPDRQSSPMQEKCSVEARAMSFIKAAHSKGKTNLQDLTNPQNMNVAPNDLLKPHCKSSKQIDLTNMDSSKEIRKAKREVAEIGYKAFMQQYMCQEKLEQQQGMHKEKVEERPVKKSILKCETQSTTLLPHENCDDIVCKHEPAQRKDVIPREQTITKVDVDVSQQHSAINDLRFETVHQKSVARKEHTVKAKLQTITAKNSVMKLKNTGKNSQEMKKQKGPTVTSTTVTSKRNSTSSSDTDQVNAYMKGSHQEKQSVRSKSSAYHELHRKFKNENLEERRPLKTVADTDKEKNMPPILAPAIRKPMHNPSAQKVEVTKVIPYKNDSGRILVEEPMRNKITDAKNHKPKQQTSILHELEHRWKERTAKAGATVSTTIVMEHQSQQKVEPTTPQCSFLTDSSSNSRLPDKSTAPETNAEFKQVSAANCTQSDCTTLEASSVQPTSENFLKEGQEVQSIFKETQFEGPADRRQLSDNNSLRWQNQATCEVGGPGLLTTNEHTLKQILMNSQHFLSTAQAFFKIKIPVGVLQASEKVCQDEGSKLILDCGYELMSRKGKREEMIFANKTKFISVKVRCLDALIEELNGDLESLELPSKIKGNDDIAEDLHNMIERDVQNKNPDVNSMWDFGWNSMLFATIGKDEIIRDVEMHVLNELITDITRDLMSVSITAV